ncbi:MAG TPA: UDP-glucose 4-epimerase GalE [Actinocrinis sp.]|jgi:UDP-glucose 4-epimerase
MTTWLVTGGAGYIGAHVVRCLLERPGGVGERAPDRVIVFDDFSTGFKDRLPAGVAVEVGSVRDRDALDRVFAAHKIDGVIHFAAKKQIGESVEKPLWYYQENLGGLATLLEATVAAGVRRFLYSSSAAVYGSPGVDVVTEDTACAPDSPYGETKLAGEWMIRAAAAAHGLAYVNLRYFNVAGAGAPELADVGAFNLIPMVFERLEAGQAPIVFGADYPTPDGTCIRDFIHVQDLAEAHVAATGRLVSDPAAGLTLNVGRGQGVSVREVVDAIAAHTGLDTHARIAPRRPGDIVVSIAAADRIRTELGWTARYGLGEMVASAWAGWRRQHQA